MSLSLRLGGGQIVLLRAPAVVHVVVGLCLRMYNDIALNVANAAIVTVAGTIGLVVRAMGGGCRRAAMAGEAGLLVLLGMEALGKVEAREAFANGDTVVGILEVKERISLGLFAHRHLSWSATYCNCKNDCVN